MFLWKWYFSGHSRAGNTISLIFPGRQDLPENALSVLLHKLSPNQNTMTTWNVYKLHLCQLEKVLVIVLHLFGRNVVSHGGKETPWDKRASCWGVICQCCGCQTVLMLVCWASEAAQAARSVARGEVWMLCPSRCLLQLQVMFECCFGSSAACCFRALRRWPCGFLPYTGQPLAEEWGWSPYHAKSHQTWMLWSLWFCPHYGKPLGWEHTLCAAWQAEMHVNTIAFFLPLHCSFLGSEAVCKAAQPAVCSRSFWVWAMAGPFSPCDWWTFLPHADTCLLGMDVPDASRRLQILFPKNVLTKVLEVIGCQQVLIMRQVRKQTEKEMKVACWHREFPALVSRKPRIPG